MGQAEAYSWRAPRVLVVQVAGQPQQSAVFRLIASTIQHAPPVAYARFQNASRCCSMVPNRLQKGHHTMSEHYPRHPRVSRRMAVVFILQFLGLVLSPGVDLWRDDVIRAWPEWRWSLPWVSGFALFVLAAAFVLLFFEFRAELRKLRQFLRESTDGVYVQGRVKWMVPIRSRRPWLRAAPARLHQRHGQRCDLLSGQ